MKKCIAPGCLAQCEKYRKLCSMHRSRMKRYGSYNLPIKIKLIYCSVEGCANKKPLRGRICDKHRWIFKKHGDYAYEKPTIKEKLIKNSILNEISGCIEWTKYLNKAGYGKIFYKGKSQHAHRLSYELFVSDILEGLCVLHKCDNPKCINPEHLFLGSINDNVQDMINKGRASYGFRGYRKLQINDREEIIKRKKSGEKSSALAKEYDVNVCTINRIFRKSGE